MDWDELPGGVREATGTPTPGASSLEAPDPSACTGYGGVHWELGSGVSVLRQALARTQRKTPRPRIEESTGRTGDLLPIEITAEDLSPSDDLSQMARDSLRCGRLKDVETILDEADARGLHSTDLDAIRNLMRPPEFVRVPSHSIDRNPDWAWIERNRGSHRGCWIAIASGTLVATASTGREMRLKLREMKATGRVPVLPLVVRIDVEGRVC